MQRQNYGINYQYIKVKSRPGLGSVLMGPGTEPNRTDSRPSQEMPAWSNGWLDGFKQRHKLRSIKAQGEASSVNQDAVREAMDQMREEVQQYAAEDVYNMDESGLFWKMSPDRWLATGIVAGTKKQKSRITVVFACNSTGSDRVPLWMIGTVRHPRCFKHVQVHTLNCTRRHNATA